MGQTSYQIERHIQETRNNLGDNFNELEEKVKTAVDWRAQFEERPVTMMALAFGGGLLLSALLLAGRSSRRKSADNRRNESPDHNVAGLSIRDRLDDKTNQISGNWNSLKGALIGVATTKLSGFIEDLLPGFKQEFTRAQTGERVDWSGSATSGRPTRGESTAAGAD